MAIYFLTVSKVLFFSAFQMSQKNGFVLAIHSHSIVSDSGVFIKRLNQKINGQIEIISDNKDYPVNIAMPNDFTVIGKAVSSFNSIF